MKPSSTARRAYTGPTRSIVIALDVGTTFSGVSYAILEPGEVPKTHGVTRFPGQEHVSGNSKIPTVIYYDRHGKLMAAGAEADTSSVLALAEDEDWVKVELFKLRLRPRIMNLELNGMRLSRLPKNKTAVQVFGDFLGYLFRCTRNFIRDTHANGAALWGAVEKNIQFILSHPNGWQGAEQAKIRAAAIYGGLIPDTNSGKARVRFVTEGEASLHSCCQSGLAAEVISSSNRSGFLIVDLGGGTIDLSSYTIVSHQPIEIEEIAPPDCIFAGSVFVSRRARQFLLEKLKHSKYGTPDTVDHIAKRFDETTKRLFRDKKDPQFIPFGSPLDKDLSVGIRSGQLKLTGEEVADLFEPSIQAVVYAIRAQIEGSSGSIKSIFLVGGYAANAWLFAQLQDRLAPLGVSVNRPDMQTSKAVADGAIGFYCDHYVSTRMSKCIYGVEFLRQFDPKDPEHVRRKGRLCELPSGPKLLQDAFDCILARGVKVKESTVFSRKYSTELTSLSSLSVFEVEIWCYRGGNEVPKWIHRSAADFSTLCLVRADLSPLSSSAEPRSGKSGRSYWTIIFSVEIHFGLTEFKARIKWVDNGTVKYGPASIIFNEHGQRAEEEDLDNAPDDDFSAYPSSSSRQSPVTGHANDVVAGALSRNARASSAAGTPRVDLPLEDERARAKDKGKGREVPQDRLVRAPAINTRSSSTNTVLGEALTSVWGPSGPPISPNVPSAEPFPASTPRASATSARVSVRASPRVEDVYSSRIRSRTASNAPGGAVLPEPSGEPLFSSDVKLNTNDFDSVLGSHVPSSAPAIDTKRSRRPSAVATPNLESSYKTTSASNYPDPISEPQTAPISTSTWGTDSKKPSRRGSALPSPNLAQLQSAMFDAPGTSPSQPDPYRGIYAAPVSVAPITDVAAATVETGQLSKRASALPSPSAAIMQGGLFDPSVTTPIEAEPNPQPTATSAKASKKSSRRASFLPSPTLATSPLDPPLQPEPVLEPGATTAAWHPSPAASPNMNATTPLPSGSVAPASVPEDIAETSPIPAKGKGKKANAKAAKGASKTASKAVSKQTSPTHSPNATTSVLPTGESGIGSSADVRQPSGDIEPKAPSPQPSPTVEPKTSLFSGASGGWGTGGGWGSGGGGGSGWGASAKAKNAPTSSEIGASTNGTGSGTGWGKTPNATSTVGASTGSIGWGSTLKTDVTPKTGASTGSIGWGSNAQDPPSSPQIGGGGGSGFGWGSTSKTPNTTSAFGGSTGGTSTGFGWGATQPPKSPHLQDLALDSTVPKTTTSVSGITGLSTQSLLFGSRPDSPVPGGDITTPRSPRPISPALPAVDAPGETTISPGRVSPIPGSGRVSPSLPTATAADTNATEPAAQATEAIGETGDGGAEAGGAETTAAGEEKKEEEEDWGFAATKKKAKKKKGKK